MRRPWTNDEDRLLRKYYGSDLTAAEIAEVLERSENAVGQHANKLGLRTDRLWTDEQIATVEQMIAASAGPVYDGAAIAAAVGKSKQQVYRLVKRLALSPKRWTKDLASQFKDFIRRKHAEEWSDGEIAAAWTAEHPQCPADRRWLSEVRADQLGLPAHGPTSKRYRKRVAAKTKEQLAKAGLPSIGYLRREAFKVFCIRQGWPQVARPRLAQILNLLYERGPHTRPQIAAALGLKWGPKKSHPNGQGLAGNGPGGSYLAELQRLKLVVRLPRTVRYGPRKGQARSAYAIAPGVVRGPVQERSAAS